VVKKYNTETCELEVSKHLRNTWMKKWDWDYEDLRDAIKHAYRTKKVGKKKYEIYIRKNGEKKIVCVYYWEFETLFIITGSEG
jgi:hypothetical protein